MNIRQSNIPEDHPKVLKQKIGVIIGNLGTPDATDYWSMRRYLKEFLSDRRVIDYSPWVWKPILNLILLRRPFSSGEAYKEIWNIEENESPLLTITKAQAHKLRDKFKKEYGDSVLVDFCMRYGNPSTESTLKRMVSKGCTKIVFFPLYPQYAAPTTATANDQMFKSLMKLNWQPSIRIVPPYFDNNDFIKAISTSIKTAYKNSKFKPQHLVLSYHGVPERYLMNGDPYHCQCQKTTRLIREKLNWKESELTTAFQSKFGPEKWVGPATVDLVADLAKSGKESIAIIAPSFASDCVETLEEICGEISESFIEAGGKDFLYIPCLNDDKAHIDMFFKIIKKELLGWI
ncbi:MAG: ferrochelatase [Rhodobacteraceae bacterium]|nr:ferrochelatase [Paracoccaceae bacterium]